MSYLIPKSAMGALTVAFFFLIASPHRACAETTTLICHASSVPWTDDDATTIDLNEPQSSVVIHFPGHHDRDGNIGYPYSLGPLQASFGTDIISITDPKGNLFQNYTINRLTGKFVAHAPHEDGNWQWDCQPGKKQF
jgi:hypothetical protein